VETLDPGIPSRTMVAQLASLSLVRALFLGAAAGRWGFEVCQGLCGIYLENGPVVDGGDDFCIERMRRSRRVCYIGCVLLFRHKGDSTMPLVLIT
jgi:hypothetical protein